MAVKDRARAARDRQLLGIVDGVKPYHRTLAILLAVNRKAMRPAEVEEYVRRGIIAGIEEDRGSTG